MPLVVKKQKKQIGKHLWWQVKICFICANTIIEPPIVNHLSHFIHVLEHYKAM